MKGGPPHQDPPPMLITETVVGRYETITDLMTLQDQIDTFQKLIFSHFRGGANNECRISALVPLVQESYGIYKFVTSMLRAMHTSKFFFFFFALLVTSFYASNDM